MTKKDYIKIAQILASNQNVDYIQHKRLCEKFASMLKADNPLFDYNRFLDAAKAL